jgi:hypothetical protein
MSKEDREALFEKFPLLHEQDVTLKDIEHASEDLHNLRAETIMKNMEEIVAYLLKTQVKSKDDNRGAWLILNGRQLIELDSILYGKYALKIEEWIGHRLDQPVPNAWTNALITLILKKWLGIIGEWTSPTSKQIKAITNAIKLSNEWLEKHRNESDGIFGWSPFPPQVSGNLVNTYDTSFVYISLCYDSQYMPCTRKDRILNSVQEVMLSSKLHDAESGAWYTDNTKEHRREDVGATSYATVVLQKLRDEFDLDRETIDRAIGWLCARQNPDGGWSRRPNERSVVDQTCLAMMTLQRCAEESHEKITRILDKGVAYLDRTIELYECDGYGEKPIQILCWSKNEEDGIGHPCIRTSSLAISTLIKCDMPIFMRSVRRSVSGLMRLYKNKRANKKEPPIMDLDEAYFFCMLADYLKAWIRA